MQCMSRFRLSVVTVTAVTTSDSTVQLIKSSQKLAGCRHGITASSRMCANKCIRNGTRLFSISLKVLAPTGERFLFSIVSMLWFLWLSISRSKGTNNILQVCCDSPDEDEASTVQSRRKEGEGMTAGWEKKPKKTAVGKGMALLIASVVALFMHNVFCGSPPRPRSYFSPTFEIMATAGTASRSRMRMHDRRPARNCSGRGCIHTLDRQNRLTSMCPSWMGTMMMIMAMMMVLMVPMVVLMVMRIVVPMLIRMVVLMVLMVLMVPMVVPTVIRMVVLMVPMVVPMVLRMAVLMVLMAVRMVPMEVLMTVLMRAVVNLRPSFPRMLRLGCILGRMLLRGWMLFVERMLLSGTIFVQKIVGQTP